MTTDIDTSKVNPFGFIAWFAVVLVTGIAFFGTYYLKISGSVLAIMWSGWLILALFFMYFTTQGKQVYDFAQESRLEMLKVVWPGRQETVQTTMIVMAMVAVTGFVLWAIDLGMMWLIGKITHLG